MRRTGMLPALLGCFAILAAQPATAEEEEQQLDSEDVIVIEGDQPVSVRDVRRQAGSITPREGAVGAPLARMRREVCVGVYGLAPDSARLVIDRIYYNAEAVGLKVSEEEGCTANIVVAVVEDPREEFASLRRESSRLVEGIDLWERKRVAEQEGPALAWNAVATTAFDGSQPIGRGPPVFESTMSGRTGTHTLREIMVSVVLVDSEALAGLDGVTLADYATMRSLAHTRAPIEAISAPTVLGLFTAEGAPDRLSAFDRGYLRSLYGGPGNRPLSYAMSDIGREIRREMEGRE
ncbi:hypothetical protein [Alteraurantiacibacter aquimixticola]|uniref:DUF2927 domain-containing protein n=1 Tax=Alteraurantiacibacter aquimixticola TaxID=2489173 RepID=A0A4T3F034_9SPHN|nr:hypothetical protein [Alteraurantiacibacter aquimixticola]TIX49794.1 hypothetical protein E5222_13375 [Alteraurantiacibacter aquimixticola]